MVPTQGLSIPNVPGGAFWDPDADAGFLQALKTHLRPEIPITTHALHINATEFALAVADRFVAMLARVFRGGVWIVTMSLMTEQKARPPFPRISSARFRRWWGPNTSPPTETDRLIYSVDSFWMPQMWLDRGVHTPQPDVIVHPRQRVGSVAGPEDRQPREGAGGGLGRRLRHAGRRAADQERHHPRRQAAEQDSRDRREVADRDARRRASTAASSNGR